MPTLVEEFFHGVEVAPKPTESKRLTIEERTAIYETRMDALLDPRNAYWPGDGQPGDMGDRVRAMLDTPPAVRIENMRMAKYGGAYADAEKMVSMGYAIGYF